MAELAIVSTPQNPTESDELKRFLYVVSHDLSAPARQVKTFLSMLEEGYSEQLDADARELIQFAVGGAECMQRLLADLLQYSRLETESPSYRKLELDDIVDHVTSAIKPLVASRQAQITCGHLPAVFGDENQLTRVLEQLISNAILHNQSHRPEVLISADTDSNMHVISVTDNGSAIDERHREAVFELFHRLDGASSQQTGAGLAIARRIARKHGGDLSWDSHHLSGNRLHLLLPDN